MLTEQYSTTGAQDVRTDEYALCATMYYLCKHVGIVALVCALVIAGVVWGLMSGRPSPPDPVDAEEISESIE